MWSASYLWKLFADKSPVSGDKSPASADESPASADKSPHSQCNMQNLKISETYFCIHAVKNKENGGYVCV